MGGKIGVRSQLGHGSTFWFTARLEKQAGANKSASQTSTTAFSGARLLNIGDHPTSLRIVSQYLEAWKTRCDSAKSKEEAMNMATTAMQSSDPYRLIILDNDMSEIDGITLAKMLRQGPVHDRVPIILLSSLDRRVLRHELPALGIRRVLKKPIRQDDLKRAVLRSLSGASDTDPFPPAASPETPAATPQAAPNLRVIVAEDNLVNQRIIAMQLRKLGLITDLAGSGHELLNAMDNKPYDLVFMDCQMPEMDGYEATRRIRASGRFPKLRIVAMTANAMQGDREKCLAAGMDDYMSKPIRMDELRKALEFKTG
jgi:CheY-like chemotaxis protein